MPTAWLFTHCNTSTFFSNWNTIQSNDILIAVDSGADFLYHHNRLPNILIGDCDSISPAAYQWIKDNHIPQLKFRPEKDETDTELALYYAWEQQVEAVVIVNDFGGRFDHAVALISHLRDAFQQHKMLFLESETQRAMILPNDFSCSLPEGSLVSLIPLSDSVPFVTTTGLQYPLSRETLYATQNRGISNVVMQSPFRVQHEGGTLLAIFTLV